MRGVKREMKRRLVLLTAVVMVMGLTACAGITHCKDCDDEIYEDGYCKYHYTVHKAQEAVDSAKEAVDSAAKDVFDNIVGN